jgi:hypothetical protein
MGAGTTAICSCAYPRMRHRWMMIIIILTIFQSHICKAALFASFLLILSPPPPSATFFSYRFGGSNFSCTTLTPHLALLTSHLACVTHVPAGGVFLSFVGFWILFGLLVAYCELANRWCPKEKKSRKIIEPTSAPVNIEMTTASGGEAALPRDKGEEVQIV